MNKARRAFCDVWLIWLVLSLLTTAPYIVCWMNAPADKVFTGVLTAHDDTFTYLAWMKEARDGRLLLCDQFTSEPQDCKFFLPLWVCLGWASRLTGVPIIAAFHVARIFAALIGLIVAAAAARLVMKSQRRRRFALWMYALSGGLGWLVFILNRNGSTSLLESRSASGSIDLNLPEAFAFRSAFAQVHFSLGAAFVGGALLLLFSATVEGRIRHAFWAGALTTVLAVVHPYPVIVVLAAGALGLMWFVSGASMPDRFRRSLRIVAAFACGAFPGIAYLLYLNRSSDVLREWLRITDTLSPSPIEYILGFGVIGLLGFVGVVILWIERSPYGRLLVIWIVTQVALLYAPVNFQRRLIEGLQLPLVIAASLGAFWLTRRIRSRPVVRTAVLAGLLLFVSITNFGFWIGMLAGSARVSPNDDPRRLVAADLMSSLEWIGKDFDRSAAVFCSYFTGNIAPSVTGLRVFLGHYGQTINSEEKGYQVSAFYRGVMSDSDARSLFVKNNIVFVIYGPFEREIAGDFKPPPWLTLTKSFGSVQVFTFDGAVGERSPLTP